MAVASRIVLPELLDELAPSDPRARRSRRDLRRVHRAMGSLSILKRAVRTLGLGAPPRRILELGAGDGSLLLRLARAMKRHWHGGSLTVLDRHDLVSTQTREAYGALGWELSVLREEALDWALQGAPRQFDLCITNLFLHHFDTETLRLLMRAVSVAADAFVACEPSRNVLARAGSHLIGLLGTNRITRADAVTSVAAGFRGQELTALWPQVDEVWHCEERAALPFTHCFTAVRNRGRRR